MDDNHATRVEDVFVSHQRLIESAARRHAPDPQDIPDIVQLVGLRLCRRLQTFEGRDEAKLSTWLYRVTVNVAHDYWRQRVQRNDLAKQALEQRPLPDRVLDPDDELRASERRDALYDGLQQLSEEDRSLVMNHLQPDGVLSTRKSMRFRARRRLRDILADDPRLRHD